MLRTTRAASVLLAALIACSDSSQAPAGRGAGNDGGDSHGGATSSSDEAPDRPRSDFDRCITLIKAGDAAQLEKALSEHPTLIREGAGSGTLLHAACIEGDLTCAELLLKAGADLKVTDEQRLPPLLAALWHAKKNVLPLTKLLIEAGADPNARDASGNSLGYAQMNISFSRDHSAKLETLRFLLDHGAQVNSRDSNDGWTPLHTAVFFGDKDVILLLISRGADVNAPGKSNIHEAAPSSAYTPLYWATLSRIKSKTPESAATSQLIVDLLTSNGAH